MLNSKLVIPILILNTLTLNFTICLFVYSISCNVSFSLGNNIFFNTRF